MIKKAALLLTVAALGVTTAACGGNDPQAGTATSAPGNASATKPVIRQLLQYSNFDPSKEYTAKAITEKTGYEVKYEMLPAENPDEKLNLLMANKEEYDVMKLGAPQFEKLASQGALEPLDDLIEKFGPNIKSAIDPAAWDSAKVNGKIYAIPETGSGLAIGEETVVRQDIMDELGLKIPTNTDEFYTVLKTIKEKKNIAPYTGSKDTKESIFGDIGPAFGITTDWVVQDGKLIHQIETPAMKEFLTYMNKLYKEGLIDQEMPINTSAKAIEKFTSGKAAVYRLAYWNAGTTDKALKKNLPDAKTTIVPFMKDKNGKTAVFAKANISWYISVPKASKNKEEAIKFLNAKLDPAAHKELSIGKEGTHHEVKDGKYYPILPIFNDELNNGSSFLTGVDYKKYPDYWKARVRKEPVLQKFFEDIQINAKDIMVTDPLAKAPPIADVSKNKQKLDKYQTDSMLKFISGSDPLTNYDAFVAKWKADGGEAMTKAANEWYKTAKK
ncbi:extracellular solute-binding protein [Paenibacillus lutrae]|uniref:Extracellular solute-binding protein n=1 Tax=Paenibacillus lutrae TaxID=2078573 RepID=A0A7X3FLX7_9BACL|nr:extracellular solute-binding protein [Paenibacillus lutrae]MVP02028.1 extracellular solute-binding protein [Paenibacillus lutrae]